MRISFRRCRGQPRQNHARGQAFAERGHRHCGLRTAQCIRAFKRHTSALPYHKRHTTIRRRSEEKSGRKEKSGPWTILTFSCAYIYTAVSHILFSFSNAVPHVPSSTPCPFPLHNPYSAFPQRRQKTRPAYTPSVHTLLPAQAFQTYQHP